MTAQSPRYCPECQATLPTSMRSTAKFCCTKCKLDWNNRRAIRGAKLYDLVMATRYERHEASELGVQSSIAEMCRQFRSEDQGVKTWETPDVILSRNPKLRSKATNV